MRTDLISSTESNFPQNFGESLEIFADKIGSNPETVRQALYLIKHAQPEEITTRNPRSKLVPREIWALNS